MLSLCWRLRAATPFGCGAMCWGPLLVGGVSGRRCGVLLFECWNPLTDTKDVEGVGALTGGKDVDGVDALTAVKPPALTGVNPPVLVGGS